MRKRLSADPAENENEIIEKLKHHGTIEDKMLAKIYKPDGTEYCIKYYKTEEKLKNFVDGLNFEEEDESKWYYTK